MVQGVNLAADSRRKPRGIAGRAHFKVHATDLIAQVSAIGLGQWDIEARPYYQPHPTCTARPSSLGRKCRLSRRGCQQAPAAPPAKLCSTVCWPAVSSLYTTPKPAVPSPLVSGARTPWCARVPWTRSFVRRTKAFDNRDRPTRASAAVQGDRTTINAGARLQEKYATLHTSACATSSPSGELCSPWLVAGGCATREGAGPGFDCASLGVIVQGSRVLGLTTKSAEQSHFSRLA